MYRTEIGWTYSRSFITLRVARKWARWCRDHWPATIYQGGPGGMVVE